MAAASDQPQSPPSLWDMQAARQAVGVARTTLNDSTKTEAFAVDGGKPYPARRAVAPEQRRRQEPTACFATLPQAGCTSPAA